MAYGGSFWAPGPPKLTFIESKRCHSYLFYLWKKMVCSKNPYFSHLLNPILVGLLRFRAKTMPQIKGKRQGGVN